MKTINVTKAFAILERWGVNFSVEFKTAGSAGPDEYRFAIEGSVVGRAATMTEAVLVGLAQSLVEARSQHGAPEPAEKLRQASRPATEWIDQVVARGNGQSLPQGIEPVERPIVPNEFKCYVPGRSGYEGVNIYGHAGPGMFRIKLASPVGDEQYSEWVVKLERFLPEHRDAVASTIGKSREAVETVGVDEFVDRCQKCRSVPCNCGE